MDSCILLRGNNKEGASVVSLLKKMGIPFISILERDLENDPPFLYTPQGVYPHKGIEEISDYIEVYGSKQQ